MVKREGYEGKISESLKEKSGKRKAADKLPASKKRKRGQEESLDRAPIFSPVYPSSGRLNGKCAIITGGDSGIGRAVAILFGREGANVVITYLHDEVDAQETMNLVEAEGARCLAIQSDVRSTQDCQKAVEICMRTFGSIDILVNNAAVQTPQGNILEITSQQLENTFRTNIYGMFFLVQAALPHLKSGAAIINCTSVTMYEGSANLLDYSATKGAITAFTRSLSEALVEKGIRVNAVAPGPIWTPLNPLGGADKKKVRTFGENTPMKRPGEPNEVAPSFLFLACADSSYMSGQVLHPNGGTIVNG